jgi:hypothetical protein
MITFILTSCNRADLLHKTLTSFFQTNLFPIERYIIHDDGLHDSVVNMIKENWSFIEVIGTKERVGLAKSFERLMNEVKTEWVFSCEDDWLFSGNRHFIYYSFVLMANKPEIKQVWVRSSNDHQHPLDRIEVYETIQYKKLRKNYLKVWGGFSLNPTLRRVADYHYYFPNGMSAIGSEQDCSIHVEQMGYQAVSLVSPACKHIGWHRHTENFID